MRLRLLVSIFLTSIFAQQTIAATTIGLAFKKDGRPSPFWIKAIQDRNSPERVNEISKTVQPITSDQRLWLSTVQKTIPVWEANKKRVEQLFPEVNPPKDVEIVIGNQGGDDGFTCGDQYICLDLSSWVEAYGKPSDHDGLDRVNRILLHEYAHLITKIWLKAHPQDQSTSYKRALFEMFYEGIGNYFSLNETWVNTDGSLTEKSIKTLEELTPTLRDRLESLKHDDGTSEKALRAGLSDGPFNKKWGALPVALWWSEIKIELLPEELSKGLAGVGNLVDSKLNAKISESLPLTSSKVENTDLLPETQGDRFNYWWYLPVSIIAFLFFIISAELSRLVPILRKNDILRPDLLPTSYRLHAMKTPTDSNAFLWITLITFIIWIGALITSYFSDGHKDSISDYVAIQASTLALLFPLVILILDKKEEAFLNVISSKEVLLHYAWAFPASLALPILSTYYMFNGHKAWGLILTVASVLISLFVLYRLLKITFSLKTWKDEESDLLSKKIRLITAEDLSDRIASGLLPDQLKDLAPYIEYSPYFSDFLLKDRKSFRVIEIIANRSGGVVSIKKLYLEKIFKLLKTISKVSDSEVVSRLVISIAPGSDVEKGRSRIGMLAIRIDEFSPESEAQVRSLLKQAVIISSKESGNLVAFETLFSRLGQAGRIAVETNNLEVLESLRETYVFIYNEIEDTLKAHANYLKISGDPRTVLSYGNTSNPFELIEKRLNKLIRDSFGVPGVEEEVLHNVCYFPYAICVNAIRQNDMAAYRRIIALASLQAYLAYAENRDDKDWNHTISWLEGILSYNFKIEIDRQAESDNYKPIQYDILLPVVREFQNFIRYSIAAKRPIVAKEAYDKLREELTVFKYDDLDSEISHQRSLSKIVNPEQKVGIDKALALLESKKKIKDELRFYAWTTLLALNGYLIYHLESKDPQPIPNDVRDDLFKHFMARLPTSFSEVFEFYLFFQRSINTREWQWNHWEDHPTGQVIHYSTDRNIDRVFAILFARAADHLNSDFSASEYSMKSQEVYSLGPSGPIRKILGQPLGVTEQRLDLAGNFDGDKKTLLLSIFDSIIKEAELQEDLKLAKVPISQAKVDNFKNEFCERFKEISLMREKVLESFIEPTEQHPDKKRFGIRPQLESREAFADDTSRDYGKLGHHFGEGLADSEDEMILENVANLLPSENTFRTIPEAIEFLKGKNVPLTEIFIVGDYKILRAEIDKIADFVPSYKVRQSKKTEKNTYGLLVQDGYEIPVFRHHAKSKTVSERLFVCSLNSISLLIEKVQDRVSCLSELGWTVKVTDPFEDPALKSQLINGDFDFLKGYDLETREKIVGTRVALDIFATIEVVINNPDKIAIVKPVSDLND